MASASFILNSPDYINANSATKDAIFNKHIAIMPDFTNANYATQTAIRQKFGLDAASPDTLTTGNAALRAREGMPAPRMDALDTALNTGYERVTGRNLPADLQFAKEATAPPSFSDIGSSISKEAQAAAQFAKEGGEKAVTSFNAGRPFDALLGAGQQLIGGAGVAFSPITGPINAAVEKTVTPFMGQEVGEKAKIAANILAGPKSGALMTKPLEIAANAGESTAKGFNRLKDLLKGRVSDAEINNLMKDFYSGRAEEDLFPGRVMSPDELKSLKNEAMSAPASDVTGQSMLDRIDAYIQGLRDQRRTVGKTTYGAADESMAAKHDAGNFWQESPSGQKFIASLEDQISTITETKETTGVRTELERLIRDLRGESIPQVESQVLDALGNPIETAAAANAYSRPEVLREVLRKLRDAGKGYPEEGYNAIKQDRAKELADGLAKSISGWDENLMLADMKYRDASKLLYPSQTRRGKAALAGEKFDRAELAADPASVPSRFFNSKQGVQQLTDLVGNDKQFVEQAATQHAMRSISEMTPDNAAKFLRENNGWLNYELLPQTTSKIAQYVYQRQYEPMVAPIKEMITKYEKGTILAKDLPAAVRTILANKSTSVEASRDISKQLAKIEQIQDKEKRARELLAAVKKSILIGGGLVIGGQFVARPIINRLAPPSVNQLAEQ